VNTLKLSICVVTYESLDMVKKFHTELIKSLDGYSEWEVLYFDNSKSDEVIDYITSVKSDNVLIDFDKRNMGFSYGNNRLIINCKYDNVLLLNPDVFDITNSFWGELTLNYNKQDVLFIKLLNEDGTFQDCIGKYASFSRAFGAKVDYEAINQATPIEMGIMAFMLTSKKVLAHVGLLDCDYPLYAEDMDWCYRAKRLGYSIIYNPSLVLTHTGGGSSRTRWRNNKTQLKKYYAEEIFIKKHYKGLHRTAMLALNFVKKINNKMRSFK
ncbi:hypothetical protein AI2717V1_2967, partial [Klebsiella pneumoniae]